MSRMATAVVFGVLAMLAMVAMVRVDTSRPPDGQIHIDGEVFLPVEPDAEVVGTRSGTLRVYRGSPAPASTQPNPSGEEQVLVQGPPNWDDAVWAGNVPVVYVGDVNGRSVFVHTNGTIGWMDHISAWLDGSEIGDHICLSVGDYDTEAGGIGFCGGGTASGGRFVRNGKGDLQTAWVTWVDVPTGTSVVTLSVEGDVLAWQRPRGETVFFDLGAPPEKEILLTALDGRGSEIGAELFETFWFEGPY